jgi:hypothetical protein
MQACFTFTAREREKKKEFFETLPNEIKLEFEYSLLISLPRLVYNKKQLSKTMIEYGHFSIGKKKK